MSKIEEALEKAVKMKEAAKGFAAEEPARFTKNNTVFPELKTGEAAVDAAMVDRHLVCVTEPFSNAAEQYKKLRARILNATKKDGRSAVMITSSDIGEGKTITAINLAVALGNEIDHTVLLVDADLRKPSVHKYLGIEAQYGLSDYLSGKVNLSDILVKTGIGKFILLPAGSPPENPSELLSSERMKALVHEIKCRYKDRYIIFDSPPVLMAAEAVSLAGYMDSIIFVIQAAHTTPKAATQALSLIKGCPVLGVVFNNVPEYLAKSLHSYYYHYENKGHMKTSNNGNGDKV